MKSTPGDWLMIEGTHLNDRKRHGLILEVHGPDGAPPHPFPTVPSQRRRRTPRLEPHGCRVAPATSPGASGCA
jgi:hypothetical protein